MDRLNEDLDRAKSYPMQILSDAKGGENALESKIKVIVHSRKLREIYGDGGWLEIQSPIRDI
jgi:hypothetical protein